MSLTEIVFILDKSGSMQSIKADTIGGFNSFIEAQRNVEGDTNVTLIQFDDTVKTTFESIDINQVKDLDNSTFIPSGCTAMLDAIGLGIDGLLKRLSERVDQPNSVIFAIMTDGWENASREYTRDVVKMKIENMQKEKDWQFIFLSANIDSVGTAKSIGIHGDYAGDFTNSGGKSAILFASEMVTSYRSTGNMATYDSVASTFEDKE